jgi:maltodextrin utilization protein YvdJ
MTQITCQLLHWETKRTLVEGAGFLRSFIIIHLENAVNEITLVLSRRFYSGFHTLIILVMSTCVSALIPMCLFWVTVDALIYYVFNRKRFQFSVDNWYNSMEADLCLSACNAFTISAISNINQLFYPSTTAVQTVTVDARLWAIISEHP